jgi:hypothetical protein
MLAQAEAERSAESSLDPDALLCALVLTPTAWSRNRFFALFQEPALHHARRRASVLRGLMRQIRKYPRAELRFEEREGGAVTLELAVESLGYRRSSVLSVMERALLEYALAHGAGLPTPPEARAKVEAALAKLAP